MPTPIGYIDSTGCTLFTNEKGTPLAVHIYTMGRRPPLSPSVCRLEIYQISIEQKNTLANVFLIITGPISRLAPGNSLPTISRKTKCKVTLFSEKARQLFMKKRKNTETTVAKRDGERIVQLYV